MSVCSRLRYSAPGRSGTFGENANAEHGGGDHEERNRRQERTTRRKRASRRTVSSDRCKDRQNEDRRDEKLLRITQRAHAELVEKRNDWSVFSERDDIA